MNNRPEPVGCTARHDDPYAVCERPRGHDGWHRAALDVTTNPQGEIVDAQIVSWSW